MGRSIIYLSISLWRAGGPPTTNSPAPLQYRDVFVLTRCSQLQDDVRAGDQEAGAARPRASGLVRGLRAAGLPVCVLGRFDRRRARDRWEGEVQDTAVAGSDRVTAAHVTAVFGLERKVVVDVSFVSLPL